MVQEKIMQKTSQRRRGRPYVIDPQTVIDSAETYGGWLRQFWPKLGTPLLAARSADKIARAIEQHAPDLSASLAPFPRLILTILQDRRFPRLRAAAQIQFLADSMGGQGMITPRRSREICARERGKVKHVILRREFYIECSCGYKGPALEGACRGCGTGRLSQDLLSKETRE
jgi:hypothetical protein